MYELLLIGFGVIGVASVLDLKFREVPDRLWLIAFAIVGVLFFFTPPLVLTVLDFRLLQFIPQFISIILVLVVSGLLYKFGLLGGADAKAFAFLSVLFFDKVLLIFLGALAFVMILSASNFLINSLIDRKKLFAGLEHEVFYRKILAMFSGKRKVKLGKFDLPMEVTKDGKRYFYFGGMSEYAQGTDLWVATGVPLLPLIFLAMIFVI